MRGIFFCALVFSTLGSGAFAKTWDCVVPEVCRFELGCEPRDPPVAYRLTVGKTKALMTGDSWTREMRLIKRHRDSETFAIVEEGEAGFLTLNQDGSIMFSYHMLERTKSDIGGHFGQCKAVAQ